MQEQGTKFNFEGEDIFVGIDTHKKTWKVALYHEDTYLKTFTQNPKPELLVNYLNTNYPGANYSCAYEAGFCGFWIQRELTEKGINCIVVNPADVPTTHKDKEFKTDPRDCRKIAKSLRSNLLEAIYIPTQAGIEERQIVRTYTDMSRNYTRYKNKVKSKLNFYGIEYPEAFKCSNNHWSSDFYSWLLELKLSCEEGTWTLQFYVQECLKAKELKRLTLNRLRELSKTAKYHRRVTLLRSIPGVGLITAMQFLTEIEDINRFKNLDKLCSYIGLVPTTNSSGEKDRVGDMTKRGNKTLKGAIIESAWMAIRRDTELLHYYLQLKKRMDKNKAIVRVARKLSARILYVLIKEKEYTRNAQKI